jgi:uncharacterized RDD family membrane protein YckC
MILILPPLLYYFLLEWRFSTTIGKRLLNLMVVDKDGHRCSLVASLKRNLFRFIDWLPAFYIVAAVMIWRSSDRQRLGDRIARTIVTETPEREANPLPVTS